MRNSSLLAIVHNIDWIISDLYTILDCKDLANISYVQPLIIDSFSWIAIIAGYNSFIYRYVVNKYDFYFRLILSIKHSNKHASNIL